VLEIDGTGLVTSPGFVDPHSHADINLMEYPLAENLVMQGITTILAGHCGISPAPGEDRSFGDWLSSIDDEGIAINYAPLVGHNVIRPLVMGEDFKRPATPDEISEMQRFIADAMKAGAFGMSTFLDPSPGEFATTEELIELSKTIGEFGGVYYSHTRHTQSQWFSEDLDEYGYGIFHGPVEDAWVGMYRGIVEAIEISRRSGTPSHISHMSNVFMTSLPHSDAFDEAGARETLRTVDLALEEGLDITFDVIASAASIAARSRIAGEAAFARWVEELGTEGFVEALKAEELREEIKAVQRSGRLKLGMIHTLADPYWFDCFTVLKSSVAAFQGKTIGEIADEQNVGPLDAVFDIIVADPDSEWVQSLDRRGTDASISVLLTHPAAMPSTDVGAASLEPVQGAGADASRGYVDLPPIAFGLYPHYIDTYVNERRMLTLEEAVHKATLLPARTIGIEDRGVLRVGAYADIVIFDQQEMRMTGDFQNPLRRPDGIEAVLVNGKVVYRDSEQAEIRAGKVLRHRPDVGRSGG
jgi:N-acyl-D-amino-acid deacylase